MDLSVIRATFDGSGLLTGLYTDFVHGPETREDGTPNPDHIAYPAGAVAISAEVYADLLANPGLRRWDGSAVVPYAPPPPPAPPRAVPFTVLVDALSSAQYAAIDARDRDRMQSENGGVVLFKSSKVARAAKALGMNPDDLFKLAGA